MTSPPKKHHHWAPGLDYLCNTNGFLVNTLYSIRKPILRWGGTLLSTVYEKPVNSNQWEAGVELVWRAVMWEVNWLMQVQNLVTWEVNWLQIIAHLTHRVPPAALAGGRAPDGRWWLSHRPKRGKLTGPVCAPSGSLSGAGCGFAWVYTVCVGAGKFLCQHIKIQESLVIVSFTSLVMLKM